MYDTDKRNCVLCYRNLVGTKTMTCYRIWCSDTWEYESGRILAGVFDTKKEAEQEMQLVVEAFGDNFWYEVIEEEI